MPTDPHRPSSHTSDKPELAREADPKTSSTGTVPESSSSASSSEQASGSRGRQASNPLEIPLKGWKDILLRVKKQVDQDNLGIVAPGVAFLMLLALFPALTAFVSLYGLALDPAEIEQQITTMQGLLPVEAQGILENQLKDLVSGSDTALGWGAALGILLAIYSAMKGTGAIITGLNIAYDERETRGFIKLKILTFLITLGAIVFGLFALGSVAILPAVLKTLGLSTGVELLVGAVRWLLLVLILTGGLAVLYHYAPCRERPKWRWVSPGAVLATILFLVGSMLFSWYVSNFGSYNETYGSIGGVVVLMMWLFLTAYIVLLGAELNAELELQTRVDTTEGKARPMGDRGAWAADHIGPSRDDSDAESR